MKQKLIFAFIIIIILFASMIGLFKVLYKNAYTQKYNFSEHKTEFFRILKPSFKKQINSSKNSIFIKMNKINCNDLLCNISFSYKSLISYNHICSIKFYFDDVYNKRFDKKIILSPNKNAFSLTIGNHPKFNILKVYYSCKLY